MIMKKSLLISAIIMIFSSIIMKAQTLRSNIIVFLVDDMGWQDCSVPFWKQVTPTNNKFHTPNMERLAKEGMKFTNAYATPISSPTRISMLTGMNSAHHGVVHWLSTEFNTSTESIDEHISPAPWRINGLSPRPDIPGTVYATTFPQLLKDAGYFTIHVGKVHWATVGTPGANPLNMGFMVNIGGHAGGGPGSFLGEQNYGNIRSERLKTSAVPNLEEYFGTDTYLTEALTLEAIKSLEAPINNKQPFYLNMAHHAVHSPIQADQRFYKKYIDAGLDTTEAKYASMIEGMDKSLGDIMDYLEKRQVDNNTIIIFMSDNGGVGLVPPRSGVSNTQNLPLRAAKGYVYEGGIREPMLVKWPGVVKPGSVTNQYVIIEDFFPTILEIAQINNYKMVQTIDGKSMVPILNDAAYYDTTRILIWHQPNRWMPNDGHYQSAIRQGSWKLVYKMRDGQIELYNLTSDIGETTNLSLTYPGKVKELSSILSEQLRIWRSPMPIFKSTGKVIPLPDEITN
jgi:arylsulfatase A-like enzyme